MVKEKTNIKFGVALAHNLEQVQQAYIDVVGMAREDRARKLGIAILEEKGWLSETTDGILYSNQELYVFTHEELKEFIENKGGKL